jgi:hypothetical protein
MALTCTINKGTRKIGTGSVAGGSANVSSFSQTDNMYTTKLRGFGRHVTVSITQSGKHLGRSFNTRIVSDDGAGNLVLEDVCPFIES